MTSDIDTTQFNDTPVIRKLAETAEKKSRKRTKSQDSDSSTRGRKKKYNTDEERLEARRLQQRQYRERKRAELAALKQNHSPQGRVRRQDDSGIPMESFEPSS